MTLTAANVGGWALNEILTSAQMNALQSELLKAVDGFGGGEYELADELTFLPGAAIEIQNQLEVDDGGELTIRTDGTLTIRGDYGIESSATGLIDGSVTFDPTCDILFQNSLGALDLDDLVQTYTVNLRPNYIEFDEPNNEDSWTLTDGTAPGNWILHRILASGSQIFFPLLANGGDDINSIEVTVIGGFDGGHGALPASMPEFTLVECHFITPAVDLCTVVDPSGSVGVYDAAHTVTLSAGTTGGVLPYLAQTGGYYMIRINGEAGANSQADELVIMRINLGLIRRSLVPTTIL